MHTKIKKIYKMIMGKKKPKQNKTLDYTFLRNLVMRSSNRVIFPRWGQPEEKLLGFYVLFCFLCRSQNALLSASNNALTFATGIIWNCLCMVKLQIDARNACVRILALCIWTEFVFNKSSTDHTFYCHPCSWNRTAK